MVETEGRRELAVLVACKGELANESRAGRCCRRESA